ELSAGEWQRVAEAHELREQRRVEERPLHDVHDDRGPAGALGGRRHDYSPGSASASSGGPPPPERACRSHCRVLGPVAGFRSAPSVTAPTIVSDAIVLRTACERLGRRRRAASRSSSAAAAKSLPTVSRRRRTGASV